MAADDRSRGITAIRDLRPGMKNVTCLFIVIDKGSTNQTKDGSVVRKCRVADRSASICFSLWNEQAEAIESGDILRLTKGYASLWKGGLVLYSGKYGILEKVGEFTMVFSETPDMSDTGQDFAIQASQQQQARGQSTSTMGGARGGANSNGGNGRTGMGPAINGNRNGNNHMTTVTAVGRQVNGIQPILGPSLHVDNLIPEHEDTQIRQNSRHPYSATATRAAPQTLFDPRGPKFELTPHHSNDQNFEGVTPHSSRGRTYEQFNRQSSNVSDNRYHPYQRPYSNQCPPGDHYNQ